MAGLTGTVQVRAPGRQNLSEGVPLTMLAGRIPCLVAAVGTSADRFIPLLWRSVSYVPKKNVLSFLMGPPKAPPNWLRLYGAIEPVPPWLT